MGSPGVSQPGEGIAAALALRGAGVFRAVCLALAVHAASPLYAREATRLLVDVAEESAIGAGLDELTPDWRSFVETQAEAAAQTQMDRGLPPRLAAQIPAYIEAARPFISARSRPALRRPAPRSPRECRLRRPPPGPAPPRPLRYGLADRDDPPYAGRPG